MTCAYAVRVALKKFPGVAVVDVSLNKGLATVKLNPGNQVRPKDMWEAIRKNGFTTKETHVVVRGTVIDGPVHRLRVASTNEEFDLADDPKVFDATKSQAGKAVIVEGTLMPAKDIKAPVALQVKEIRGDQ
jgi:copper chaperone CopZ